MSQVTYYQNYILNNENKTTLNETNQNSIPLYNNYQQSYYGSGYGLFNNNTNDSNNFSQNELNIVNVDKPWSRASKEPSIIQRGTEMFVGNLSLDTNEYDLYEVFKDSGEIIDVILFIYFLDKSS
jgi:RNA recognition motif-containing protein